jgi:hypothetical protein
MDYLLQILAARNLLHRIVSMDATMDALSILPGLTVVLRAQLGTPEHGFTGRTLGCHAALLTHSHWGHAVTHVLRMQRRFMFSYSGLPALSG